MSHSHKGHFLSSSVFLQGIISAEQYLTGETKGKESGFPLASKELLLSILSWLFHPMRTKKIRITKMLTLWAVMLLTNCSLVYVDLISWIHRNLSLLVACLHKHQRVLWWICPWYLSRSSGSFFYKLQLSTPWCSTSWSTDKKNTSQLCGSPIPWM